MRVIVCGSRNWVDCKTIEEEIQKLPKDSIIITGGCKGADVIAHETASLYGYKTEVYNAEWNKYGKSAGPKRNLLMLNTGVDLVLAFHEDIESSKGTKHMVKIAKDKNVLVRIFKNKI